MIKTGNPYFDTLLMAGLAVGLIILASFGLGLLARSIARIAGLSRVKQQDTFTGYVFAAPWIIGFLIFVVVPMATSLYWSMTNYRLPNDPVFVGIQNYSR